MLVSSAKCCDFQNAILRNCAIGLNQLRVNCKIGFLSKLPYETEVRGSGWRRNGTGGKLQNRDFGEPENAPWHTLTSLPVLGQPMVLTDGPARCPPPGYSLEGFVPSNAQGFS